MGLPIRKEETRYTYRDYRSWPEDERWVLIDGVAWNMGAAPSLWHQGLSAVLGHPIINHLGKGGCRLYMAPVDVFFPRLVEQGEDEVDTVVQPNFVVEILSPSTSRKDLHEKYALYERSGCQRRSRRPRGRGRRVLARRVG